METIRPSIEFIGRLVMRPISWIGIYSNFVTQGCLRIFSPPVKWSLLVKQMEFVGNRSFWINILAGIMVGGIFGFQLGAIFRIFGAQSMIGAAAAFSLARELAPIVTSFLVTGRAGSAMAAEIATMRVNEQIDAMRVMAVNPFSYLIAPRILGSILMMPFLTIFFVIAGVISSFIVGIAYYDINVADFIDKIQWIVTWDDLWKGVQKSLFFGLVFSTIGCFQGFYARGGAKGVGRATTKAVVLSYVTILVADYFITYLQFQLSDAQ